jgi:heme exporter protein B
VSFVREISLVSGKDLRVEVRSRVLLSQVLPFAGIVLLLFAFALDPDRGVLERVAPGLFWVAVLLAGLLAVGRSMALESANGTRDALRLSGIDPGAIYLGKTAAVLVELLVLDVLLGAGVMVLYDLSLGAVAPLVLATLAATIGLAATGTLYGMLTAGLRVRETLLPLLVLPALTPVMLGGTRAWEASIAGAPSEAWPWVALLSAFAVIVTAAGVAAAGPLLEEA